MFRRLRLQMVSFALVAGLASCALAEALRDPTRPLDYNPGTQSVDLELNSILIGSDRRFAVINGQQLRENEVIANSGGVRVRRIQARSVALEQGGKRWTLSLAGEPVRRTRPTEH